ncbi:DUF2497 domain-containing protein [Ensifer soli]|uniref:DUF2497 domain-containing protein n=1 Tax=Ciceribacter sp. sgz301302 TaxID=3342379 RepID=UPI0035B90B1E
MAQSNVAREPSMDEILASIRKIIESNEPGLPGFSPVSEPSTDRAFDDDGDIHLTIEDTDLVADFEAETRPVPPVEPVQRPVAVEPQAQGAAPLSLADVAARVRAASERHGSAMPSRDAPARSPDPRPAPVAPEPPVSLVRPQDREVTAEPVPVAAASEPVRETIPEPRDLPPAPVTAASREEKPADKAIASILSAETGQQVARSFDALAHAVDHGPRRSFDEIAEDMLRPMLQEWLDDNLPTLVERLVREEIERVARGPRR